MKKMPRPIVRSRTTWFKFEMWNSRTTWFKFEIWNSRTIWFKFEIARWANKQYFPIFIFNQISVSVRFPAKKTGKWWIFYLSVIPRIVLFCLSVRFIHLFLQKHHNLQTDVWILEVHQLVVSLVSSIRAQNNTNFQSSYPWELVDSW